jgi:ABC-type transporter Mla subunit MlaD
MSIEDFAKLLLAVSASFALVGISVQLMRLLGTLNDGLKDIRHVAFQLAGLLEKVGKDYGKISTVITNVATTLNSFDQGFLGPARNLFITIGGIATLAQRKINNMTGVDVDIDDSEDIE